MAAVAKVFLIESCGWRGLFFVGGAPALIAVFIRFFVKESEVWRKTKAESWSQLRRVLRGHWRIWGYLTIMMAMLTFASHGTQDGYPTYLEKHRLFDESVASQIVIVSMVGALIGGIVFGLASDRFGRRRMMICAFLGAAAVVPLWAFSSELYWIMAGGFLMQFMIQGAWGIVPAHISELSPDQVRGFLPGFAYQCGNLLSAWIAWAQATAVLRFAYPWVLAGSAWAIFAVAIVVVGLGRERRGIVFGSAESSE